MYPNATKKKRKTVKDLMDKNSPKVSDAAANNAVKSLLSAAMSKGKVKSLKIKVKMGGKKD